MGINTIGVIIPAAGKSTRFGSKDKLAEDMGGRPLLVRTVEFFTKREDVSEIIVAGPEDDFNSFQEKFGPTLSFHGVTVIQGSSESRTQTVAKALAAMPKTIDSIVIHDAARPALQNELFDRLLLASRELDAVAPAIQLQDTIKESNGNVTRIGDKDSIADSILGESTQEIAEATNVKQTIDRSNLYAVQTPQIFDAGLLRRAYEQEDLKGCTDDCQVIEKLGEPVYLVDGDSRNIKVTRYHDLQLAKSILGIKGERPRPTHKRF